MNQAFPDIQSSPYEKTKEWLLTYARAAIEQQLQIPMSNRFAGRGAKLNEIRSYARGKQSIAPYQKLLKIEEATSEDNTAYGLDYTPLPLANKFRRQALGLLRDYDYTVEARVVDDLSTKETDKFLQRVKSAVRIQEAARQVAPDVANDDTLKVADDQPYTMDEFEVWRKYSYKHRLAYEIEIAAAHVFETNKIQDLRSRWKKDWFDWGVAIAKDEVVDNEVRFRYVDPRRAVLSYCDNNTFKDLVYAGEIMTIPMSKLRDMSNGQFTEAELEDIARVTNPDQFMELQRQYNRRNRFYDDLKVEVLDLELITSDVVVYKESVNKRGNRQITKAPLKEMDRPKQGASYKNKYASRVYKIKWVINTNYCFDYGLCSNQKRRTGDPYNVSLSYHAFAYDMEDMLPVGITELMMPVIDQMQLNWLKVQQCLLAARPKGFAVDVSALEDVPITNGGTDMDPEDIIRFYVRHGVLTYRKENIQGIPEHGIPIQELSNGVDPSITVYWNNVVNSINILRDIVGLNPITDGSSINPKMLTTPTQMASAATNNALAGIVECDEKMLLSLAESAFMRIQSMLMADNVYVLSLGEETNQIIKLSNDLSIREFGISLVKRPTEEEKKILVEEAKNLFGADLVDMSDIFFIKNIQNLKAAEALLNLRIENKKRKKLEESMMLQQQNAQVQMQSAQMAEQSKQQTLQLEKDLDLRNLQEEYKLKMQLKAMELQVKESQGDKDRIVTAAGVASQMQIANNNQQQMETQMQ